MSLTLITGPANAAKAAIVFERMRAVAGEQPLLVVPNSIDADYYADELAQSGLVFCQIATFRRLLDEFAQALELEVRSLGSIASATLVHRAVQTVAPRLLNRCAGGPGFENALRKLFAELQGSFITEERWRSAIAQWALDKQDGRTEYLAELVDLYGAYCEQLRSGGWVDSDGFAWTVLNSLRQRPQIWTRPVFFYGFDDLSTVQFDAIDALLRCRSKVYITLPYEAGRIAFAGTATAVESLKEIADEHIVLPGSSDYYIDYARASLHHLERSLFEPDVNPVDPGEAIQLLEAGGDQAHAELVAAEIKRLIDDGWHAGDIAVIARDQLTIASISETLDAYLIPNKITAATTIANACLGQGILALARATTNGTPADLIQWLRASAREYSQAFDSQTQPSSCSFSQELVDQFEVQIRRREVTSVSSARQIWETQCSTDSLTELDAVAAGAQESTTALVAALARHARATFVGMHLKSAALLDESAVEDAQVIAALEGLVSALTPIDRKGAVLPLNETLSLIAETALADRPQVRDAVVISDPLTVRARRFRAVFICDLNSGKFPRRGQPNPFLDDWTRAELAAHGAKLPLHEDTEERENYLFYACISRPQERLYLCWQASDNDGVALQPSPLVDQVTRLFTPELWQRRRCRGAGDVVFSEADAPTPHELTRTHVFASPSSEGSPLAAPSTQSVLDLLAGQRSHSTGALEQFSRCGVRWLVEYALRPSQVEPDLAALRRGRLAHRFLEQLFRTLGQQAGSALLNGDRLETARQILAELVAGEEAQARTGLERVDLRSLHFDLDRYLKHEAANGAGFEPALLEWAFGTPDSEAPALELDEFELRGRVDRVDIRGEDAIVRDYKGAMVVGKAKWECDRQLQVGLYMAAVAELIGKRPVAGLYQPLRGRDLRPRGVVRSEVSGAYVSTDAVDEPDEIAEIIQNAKEHATTAARAISCGRIEPCPATCSLNGCAYPTICRASDYVQISDIAA